MPAFRPTAGRLVVALALVLGGCRESTAPAETPLSPNPGIARDVAAVETPVASDTLLRAVRERAHEAPVEGAGTVVRVLRDDTHGSPHQKFLLRIADGTTVLVAHNIGLAPRLDGLAEGDTVVFRGSYVWTPKGGTVHWTHRDPRGEHRGGWLRWQGRTYE